MTNITYNIDSYNEKLRNKESEQLEKTKKIKMEYPTIKSILDDISDYNINAIINDISQESFVKENDRLYGLLKKELINQGFDKDYLDIKYDCEKCKDTGYVKGEMCTCLSSYLAKNHKKSPLMARKGSFEEFNETLFSGEKGKFKLSPRENIINNKNKALSFVNFFDEPDSHFGLYMTGTVGSGKTFLATAIGKLIATKGYSVECLTAKEFEDAIKNFSSSDYETRKNSIMNCNLLIIDDLGIETKSEYVNNEILKLLEYRLTYNLKMIITTNVSINELRDLYKSRIYSRIVSNFTKLDFYGKDIRIEKRLKNKQASP